MVHSQESQPKHLKNFRLLGREKKKRMHSRVCERKTTRSLGILKNTIKNGKKCTNLVPNVFVTRTGSDKKEKEKKNIPNHELV